MERCLPFVALLTTLSLVNLWSTPTNAHQSIVVQPKSSAAMQHPTVRPTTSATTHRCAPGLPKGCWCSKVDGVTSITCSAIRLTAVPKNWIDAGNSVVKTLNLEHNNISEVNIGDFFGVKIERLLLSNNSLRELNFLSFWGLEYSLQTLDLSYNHFRRVPFEALRLLRNLRLLTLTGNEITSLRDFDFGYMRKLEILSLDKNPITTIDRHAFVGTQLLLLAFNWIHLGDSLADLPTDDLRYINGLSLSHNKVKTIPVGWFRNLKSLRHLSLDDNLLTSLDPETFEGVENSLVSLQLNNNRFTEVPTEALQRLGNLQTLELSHNRIRRVHRRAFNSSNSLQALDLSYNRINKISKRAFVGLDSIHKIDLRHNRLITLDDITFNGLRNGGKGRLEVYISENPWLCNCIVKWIKEELDRNSGLIEEMDTQQTHKLFADEPTCDRPAYYKGHAISSVPLEDFNCDHQYYYYYYDNDNDGDGEQAQVETDADNDTNSASYGDTGLDSKSAYEDDNDKVQSSNDDDENEDDEEEEDNEEEEEEEEENEEFA